MTMITIILITFLALMGAALTIFLKKRTPSDANVFGAPHFEGLFDPPDAAQLLENPTAADKKQRLLENAKAGDLNALYAAHASNDKELYSCVLSALSEWGFERQENLTALVSHISKSDELRATRQLAQRLIDIFKSAPDRLSTTAMIHIAALTDDAETYEQAIEAAIEVWRSGGLPGFSPEQLVELFVSQYWILAPEARRGGAGFALKRRLSGIRRELAAAEPVR